MKKIIIYSMILLISMTSCGCYSHFPIMKDELVECEREVIICTKDSFIYTFPAGQYAKVDSLVYGEGWISNDKTSDKRKWEGTISVNDITYIEAEKTDTTALHFITMAAVLGIAIVIRLIAEVRSFSIF